MFLRVNAEVHSDDFVWSVKFNAINWFEKADLPAIFALARIGWRGDYAADDVAHFFEEENPEIQSLLAYCLKTDQGFEVVINSQEAEAWVKLNRPFVYQTMYHDEIFEPLREKEKQVCVHLLELSSPDAINKVSEFIVELKEMIREQQHEIAQLKGVTHGA